VRVIGPDGKQLGIMRTREALELAYSLGLDLVEVAPTANPPVCKVMDYGKFKYEEKKRMKEAKKRQTGDLKEISFRPSISKHDFETKLRKVRTFLEQGHKVKIRIFFKGREIVHQDLGRKLLSEVLDEIRDMADVENPPRMEERNLITLVRPKSKKGG